MEPLQTQRLLIRPLVASDAQFWFELHQSPDLLRFIPTAALASVEEAAASLPRYANGGWWCVTLADGTPVGTVVIKPIRPSTGRSLDELEVGWRTHAAHTGRGYATEAAVELLRSRWPVGRERIIAVVLPENVASQRVAAKVGMTHVGRTDDFYDTVVELFEIRRSLD